MIPLLTIEQVRAAEDSAVRSGRTEAELMFEAGESVADEILASLVPMSGTILVLCGPGKNGGDGIVAACALLASGWEVTVWGYQRDGHDDAPVDPSIAEHLEWAKTGDELSDAIADADVILDAVFGIGGRPELPQTVRDVFAEVQRARLERGASIWALDVPSGIDADTGAAGDGVLEADVTVVIGSPKIGLYRMPAARYTGRHVLVDIDLDPPADIDDATPRLITERYARTTLPRRRAGAHKRSTGTLLVVGGSPNYYGAPRLACQAALRSGAGLVTLAAPSSVIASVAVAVPEVTFVPLPAGERARTGARMAESVREKATEYDALLIGPGLGAESPAPEFLAELLGLERSARGSIGFGAASIEAATEPFTGKAVVDADALNVLASRQDWWTALSSAELVLTPHPKELARLLDGEVDEILSEPWSAARSAARKFGQVVVLKHAHSVVATPDGKLMVAPNAPPSLATAGTGDVLAGVIASLLGQGLSSADAAACGILIGLEATELAEAHNGVHGMIASDIIIELGSAVRHYTEPRG